MRDSNRIKPFMEKIEKLWLKYPDYRFGQLIMVIAKTNEQNPKLFNIEEDEFLRKVDELNDLLNKNNN